MHTECTRRSRSIPGMAAGCSTSPASARRSSNGEGDGLLNVFVPHATAGVVIMELGAGSDSDLMASLDRLLPRDDRWRHSHGSPGHGADHVLPLLVAPSIVRASRRRSAASGYVAVDRPARSQPGQLDTARRTLVHRGLARLPTARSKLSTVRPQSVAIGRKLTSVNP